MRIAVLFDGAGLARLGLEQAGHDCTGFELNPVAHYLSRFVGSGNCVLGDVRKFDFSEFDAIWASPPCQLHSQANQVGTVSHEEYADVDLLEWSLELVYDFKTSWVENVIPRSADLYFGPVYNAAQFLKQPRQNRNRMFGGRFPKPAVRHPYRRAFPDICPCITATEYKGCASDTRRASRFYGRRLTVDECAWHQGFSIPDRWRKTPKGWTEAEWSYELYRAIGNGVPVYMAKAFGKAVNEKYFRK
jgi:site-specific DNA-cytosine methylase